MDIAFLELAHRCAPGIEISLPTLAAVISVESGFAPLSIRVGGRWIEPAPKSKGEAVAIAVGLMDEGKSVALGLGGIDSDKLSRAGLSIVDAFYACRNVAGLAQLLDREFVVARKAGHAVAAAERIALLKYGGKSADASAPGYDFRVAEARSKLGNDLTGLVVREADPPRAAITRKEAQPIEPSVPPVRAAAAPKAAPAWDVFGGAGTTASVLVFNQQEKRK
jgi:type IV secretion system protein VirB1